MITVVFDEKNEYARAAGLWQWDYGQVLRIQGLTLPTAVEIHFSLAETGGQAITRVGVTRDGVTEVVIPDSMLENGPAAGSQYTIYAWLYLTDSTSGQTIRRISLQVRTRSKPEPFDTPEAEELFRRAIDTVNEAVKKAEDIGTGAETAAGEAKTAASEAGKSLEAVQRLADQVQLDADAAAQDKIAVEKIAAQAQESAFMAGLSEQSARTSETAAKQAQAGAEAAEDASRQHAEAAEEDRMEVSEARKAVEQAVADIVADRELIKQNAKDLTDVKNELTEKADAIVESANGNGYCMPDSADEPLRSLRILGKSTQNGEASPESPVPIVNAGDKGNIGIKIEGKNLIPESEIENTAPLFKKAFLKGYLLKAGVTYTLSTKGIVSGIYFNNVGETEKISYAYGAKSVTYTPNVDILTTLRVWDDGSHISDLKDYYIQLEVGDTATGYEPYKTPQNLTVQTPNGLLGIPVKSGGNYTDHDGRRWICDEIDYGQSVYIRRIGKTVVDGENIKFTASADENYWNLPSKSSPGIISGGIISAFFKTGIFPANITNQFIFVKKESISSHFATVDELNAFCVQKNTEGTPVEFYYTTEPIETPLSPEDVAAYKQLRMNYPATTILNDENAEIDVTYVADTKNYIQKRESTMQKQLSAIQAALISQKISGGGVKVTDSSKMPLKNLRLCGRSSQVVTTGAQLFDIKKATTHPDSYGLKVSINGQYVNIKGTAKSELSVISFTILHYDSYDLSGKSYKIKAFNLRGTHSIQAIFGFRNENEKAIALTINISSKKNVDIVFQIMVSKDESTKWEPYTGGKPAPSPMYPQNITDAGNDGNIVAKIEGKNLIDIESGIVAGWNINLPELKLIPGETYSLTNVNVPVNIALFEETTNTRLTVNYIASGRKDTFIMPDIPDAKIFISGTNATWNKGDLSTIKIQLELGPAATEYEPYKPAQTLIIPTPGGLPGIPVSSGGNYTDEKGQQWICDEIDLAREEKVNRIVQHIFDEKDSFAYHHLDTFNISRFSWIEYTSFAATNTPVMCEKFRYLGVGKTEEGGISGANGFARCFMYVNSSIDTIDKFKEMIIGSKILYISAEPIRTPLSSEEIVAYKKLCMNYPVTTITNSDNCGMEVAYTADTKAYIDGKIAEISAVIVSK